MWNEFCKRNGHIGHYLLTYLLTPWCRVLLEQLTGLQLVKKFSAFHGTRKFITALTTVRNLSLSCASPIQSIYPHPTSCRSILILSTHLRLGFPSGLLLTYSTVHSPSWAANWFAASQEIPRISRNPKFHYRTHNRPPPVSILGQPNPIHISTSNLLQIHPTIIHPSKPRSPRWSLSLWFPHQDPIHPPLLTHTRHMPSPSHYSRFYHPHNIGWGYLALHVLTLWSLTTLIGFVPHR